MTTTDTGGPRTSAPSGAPGPGGGAVAAPTVALREAAAVALTVALAALAVLVVLPVTAAPLDVPFEYTGDANSHHMIVASVLEGSWYYEIPRLGAPLGAENHDFPTVDIAFLALFAVLGWLTGGDSALVLNLVYLLGYLGIAAATHVALRGLRVAIPLASAFGVIFAFLPFHLIRGQSHLFLSAYVAVPLVGLVLYRQLGERPAFRSPSGRWTLRDGRTWLAVGACALVAGTGVYYAVFTVILLAVVGLVRLAADRDPCHLASSAGLATVTTALVLASLAPTIAYQRAEGLNPVTSRVYAEAEQSGLKPLRLLLPIAEHRVEELGVFMQVDLAGAVRSEAGANLGLVGSLGLLGVIASALVAGVARRPPEDARAARLGSLALIALLVASTAGAGYLLGALGFTEIRGWNRMTVFVGFFALAGAAVLLDDWFTRSRAPAPVVTCLAALIGLLGVWDQTPAIGPDARRRVAVEWASDEAFVGGIEERLGPGAAVFQLPHVPFPEGPVTGDMADYDHLKGYLHSDALHWSYGGMKGRQDGWQERATQLPVPLMVDLIVRRGFDGLYIDRAGYDDGGTGLEEQLRADLGRPTTVSADGRLVFFDLRGAAGG